MLPQTKLDRPATFHDLVCRLIDLGYLPVPIPQGCKGPTIPGWQHLKMTKEEVPHYFNQPNMLVGILHKNTCFIDIDVYDPELSEIIAAEGRKRFPGALERVGQYPKTALVLRLDDCGFKVGNTVKAEAEIDGKTLSAQVEIRTLTRQAVVYGVHPDTGDLYKWVNGPELWETPLADLPLAEKDAIQDFRDWADETIREWAGDCEAPQQTAQVVNIGLFHNTADERATEEQFLEALKHASSTGDYESWLECLMGIHDFYGGSAAGLQVAQQWSSDYHSYDPKEVEAKWRSFEVGKGRTYKTVFHLAKANGADMSAIARMSKPAALTSPLEGFSIATHHAPQEASQDAPQAAHGALEWFDDIEPTLSDNYLVKSLLGQSSMSVIYGPSNSGKTFFALDLAFHIAAGRDWRGLRVIPAGVLYLAAEGGRGVANRIAALRRETGATDIPFALRRAGMDLLKSEADLQAIYALAQEVAERARNAPLVIVIDTLSRVMAGGDENSAADMTALIRNIDALREATGAHIMLVHHTGKDTARGARGHSSLRAATDTEIEVQAGETDEGEHYRAALVSKQRDYAGGETFAFGLKPVLLGHDQDGDEVSTCTVEHLDSEEFKAARRAKTKRGKNQKIIMETFDQMLGEGFGKPNPGGVGFPESGTFWTVPMDDLRRISQGKMVGSDTGKLFRQAWDALTGENTLFCLADNLAWRIDRRKK